MADADRIAAALRYQQDMEGPITMNPNIAEQGRKGRANMAPPTSVMDPRSRDYERRSRETENFLIGADILAGALPFAPLAKGAVMAAGKYAGPELARGLENYMARTGLLQTATDWKASPLVKIGPSGKAGHLSDDVNMFVRELPNGQIEIERSPMWGQSAKPFKIQGENLEELIAAATRKATKSDTAKAAYETKKHSESLLGKLQATYGDNFTVSNSERSASQYITHTPSGTKIRVSDHDLPLGYVQPDIDLKSGSTVPNQFAEIVKTLGNQ